MPRCCLLGSLVCGLLWGLFLPAPAAGDLLGWLKGDRRSHTAEYLAGAELGVAVEPTSRPGHVTTILSPWRRYVPGVPSYSWGYFGAPYRPVHFYHKGYYGDCLWWGYRRP